MICSFIRRQKIREALYNVPKDLTCIYVFAFYGSKVNKLFSRRILREDITRTEKAWEAGIQQRFPELTGKDRFYLGNLCTAKFQ